MSTITRLRNVAARKVRVEVTKRKRSRLGFDVYAPDGARYHARTKTEAVNNLLAQLRCAPTHTWRIHATT